eukprot:TRINITY_DN9784_c0_g1_i1.p1 TRINITY_DN9784_c0_g1~~TRINITY_DN9784_c0_g1_i1.p1  ORF type:complete len:459 (-),score=96.49 TRINITY_DN9784_c0_g1_i1:40-1416(-)
MCIRDSIESNKKHQLPPSEYGIFYSGESYIIHYGIRLPTGGTQNIVYFWQGKTSTPEDKGSAALLASNLSESLGRATQARVIQNKEPEHFLSHFEGYYIVKRGRRGLPESQIQLYRLRGTNPINTTAVALEPFATSLNSNDAFILLTVSKVFIWIGKGANIFERNCSSSMVERLCAGDEVFSKASVDFLEEGMESEEFWGALGGKAPYSDQDFLVERDIHARLFQCSDSTGSIKVIEIFNFDQDDLDDDDVMLLDAFTSVFVWIGRGATQNEKEQSSQIAIDYIKSADDGRSPDSPIYLVQSGNEPPLFTVYFRDWDYKSRDLYLKKLQEMSRTSDVSQAIQQEEEDLKQKESLFEEKQKLAQIQAIDKEKDLVILDTSGLQPTQSEQQDGVKIFDYTLLRRSARDVRTPYPEGVDSQKLENHLSDSQFFELFKTTKKDFATLPVWKQLRMKKDKGLF